PRSRGGRHHHRGGDAVTNLKVGNRVIISCVCACRTWSYAHPQLPSRYLDEEGASGVGWISGHLIDGIRAEYVRVLFAEISLQKAPKWPDAASGRRMRLSPPPRCRRRRESSGAGLNALRGPDRGRGGGGW